MENGKERPIMVIHMDGRRGFLTTNPETGETFVKYDDGTTGSIEDTSQLYRVGSTVYGNKMDISVMEEMLQKQQKVCDHYAERVKRIRTQFKIERIKYDNMRKQYFNLLHQMRPDWKEHMEEYREQNRTEKQEFDDDNGKSYSEEIRGY